MHIYESIMTKNNINYRYTGVKLYAVHYRYLAI